MAGVQAHADAIVCTGGVQQLRELLERAPERAAGAGGVLQVQLTALAVGQRLRDRLPGARDRLAHVTRLGRAGVQHHPGRADRLTDAQGVRERFQRLGADVGVLAGAVEQVDGMDQHRFDRAVVHRRAERCEVLLRVGGRAPHARGLIEYLNRLTAAFDAALDRFWQAARGRDVRSD